MVTHRKNISFSYGKTMKTHLFISHKSINVDALIPIYRSVSELCVIYSSYFSDRQTIRFTQCLLSRRIFSVCANYFREFLSTDVNHLRKYTRGYHVCFCQVVRVICLCLCHCYDLSTLSSLVICLDKNTHNHDPCRESCLCPAVVRNDIRHFAHKDLLR